MNPTTFKELALSNHIQRALEAEKYDRPTPIQLRSIPPLLKGRDLLGCAQTGTGKTAAFALPILDQLDRDRRPAVPNSPRVLVLSPTRELAVQIGESFRAYGRHVRYRQSAIYGGVNQSPQVRALQRGVHIAVATPGRLIDLMEQGHVRFDGVETFVLDEADRMLDMGFLPALKRIIAKLPQQRQTLFFSATLPPHLFQLAKGMLDDPVRIEVAPQSTTAERVKQKVMFVAQSDKRALLLKMLQETDYSRTLVFIRTKRGADRLARQLSRNGVRSDAIHGDKSQNARQRALESFRQGRVPVLVATDVAARGIDVDGISHVVNYDLPHEPESYVHRIGRTGRAGAEGSAVSFCDVAEQGALRLIEKLIRVSISVDEDHPYHFVFKRTKPSTEAGRRPPGKRPRRTKNGGARSSNNADRPSRGAPVGGRANRRRRKPASRK